MFALNVCVFITAAAAVRHAQIVCTALFIFGEIAEGSSGDKNHGDYRDVADHVVAYEKQLASKKPKSQTPKAAQHDHCQVLALVWNAFKGVVVDVQ